MKRGNSFVKFVKALCSQAKARWYMYVYVCLRERWFWRETWGLLEATWMNPYHILSHRFIFGYIWQIRAALHMLVTCFSYYWNRSRGSSRYRSSSLATIQYFMMDQSLGDWTIWTQCSQGGIQQRIMVASNTCWYTCCPTAASCSYIHHHSSTCWNFSKFAIQDGLQLRSWWFWLIFINITVHKWL